MAEKPLHALTGVQLVPAWALRPGAYEALKKKRGKKRDLAREMQVFLVLYSRNADFFRPSYATLEQLGATLGITGRTISRHLRALEDAHLVFKVDRGMDQKQRRRPPARWALDPFTAERWRPKVEEVLAAIAEEDGHDGRWLHRAVTSLDAFERRNRQLGAELAEDMLVKPKRKRRKKKKKKRATRKNVAGSDYVRRGDVSTTGEVVGERPGRGPVGRENGAKKTGAAAQTKDDPDSTTTTTAAGGDR